MRKERRWIWVLGMIVTFLAGAITLPGQMVAGDLEPPGAPGPTMKTLDEIPPTWSQKLAASDRFELVLDGGAVLDKETGLVWEKSPDTTAIHWINACVHCYRREVDGRMGWRLPTVEELASLVDSTQHNPPLPSGHPFLNVQSDYYWSSSTFAGDTNKAWGVEFTSAGAMDVPGKNDYNAFVWCVRGGHGHDGY